MPEPERPGTAVNAQALGRFGSQAAARLRAGFERSCHPMLLVDDQRRWIAGNFAGCELLGVAGEEIPWRTMDEFTSPSGRRRLEQHWAEFLTNGAAEGWYELHVPQRGAVHVEFSALAHVLPPSRHLAIFVPPDEQALGSPPREPAWAPVVVRGSRRARLTAREREIMTLIAEGGQSSGMAEGLFLSPETVKTHVNNAMGKLGAHTRAHAVAIALVTGQIIASTGDVPAVEVPPE